MAHIIEEYEKSLGVKRDKPVINRHFFPIDCEKFVLFYAPRDVPAKKYKHYFIVVDLLKSFCKENGYKIYQFGKEEDLIPNVDKIYSDLSFRQQAYLISKASIFVSVDNVYSQYASSQKIPMVNLFSNVYSSVTRGAWQNKQFNIEPEWKVKPCLQQIDPEQSIDSIMPESVVSGIIKLLQSDSKINFKTLHIGESFYSTALDIVPTDYKNLDIFHNKILNIRADYEINDQSFLTYIHHHKCNIFFRNKVIHPNLIEKVIHNIQKITFIFDELDNPVEESYFEILKSLNIEIEILLTNEDLLQKARLMYFDQIVKLYKPVIKKPEYISENANFFSLKRVIEGDKSYLSKAHWQKREIVLDKITKIVDTPEYWEELDYYYIYEQQ